MYKKHIKNNIFNKLLNQKNIIIFILFIIIYVYFRSGTSYLPVEDLNIPAGVGCDLILGDIGTVEYSIPISVYNYGRDKKITSIMRKGIGSSIPETRNTRQLVNNKKVALGIEKIVICSEELSKFGMKNLIDILFKNPSINDTALIAVCKGKSEHILTYQVPQYPSSSDYIEGMLEHCKEFNFFSDNYKLIDIFVRMEAEGRSVVLPYIEIKDGNIEITGMALFKKDIMVKKICIDESRAMNILREDDVKGVITLQENPKKYIGYYATTKRKVRCVKKGDMFRFFIDLSLNGEIVENDLFHNIYENEDTMKKFENDMSESVEKMCSQFIEEMQNNYKVDCLQLGRVAAAKYGRHKGIDWDEVICNPNKTEIIVNAKVNVEKMGRGDY